MGIVLDSYMDSSIFDIIGPKMIGPSSSHTAGAAKIAYMARKIFGYEIAKVDFGLHGSFAKTYQGHGTDKALLAGVMGMKPYDERMNISFQLAEEKGLMYSYYECDLGEVHPNTVRLELESEDGHKQEIIGSSIGGGKAIINRIDGIDVNITGDYCTLITTHQDYPGVIAKFAGALASHDINIAFMKVFREEKGSMAIMVIEVDQQIDRMLLPEFHTIQGVERITYFNKVEL